MANVMEGLYYSESHEYVRVEGEYGYVGITDYAQNALGTVVYVDMPEVDDDVEAGSDFGAVESVKAASDLISPVSGVVVEVNSELEDTHQQRCLRQLDHQGEDCRYDRTRQPHERTGLCRILRKRGTLTTNMTRISST